MLDDRHLNDLAQILKSLSRDNVGDVMVQASMLASIVSDFSNKIQADQILRRVRNFARDADIGWRIFEKPIMPNVALTEVQIWQIIAIIGTLMELNYSFERVEEATMLTFENSTPVRFYVNGIFHYLATLFLLDAKDNEKKGYSRPGTLIKVLQPIKLHNLLNPVYQVLDRPFGENTTYGQTILSTRNKGFVHGSFSPENIQRIVKDTHIFNEVQRIKFIQNHWDLFDRLIILRLQLLSILTLSDANFDIFSPSKLFHL